MRELVVRDLLYHRSLKGAATQVKMCFRGLVSTRMVGVSRVKLPSKVVKKDNSQDLPPSIEPLVLWSSEGSKDGCPVVVDPLLVRFLRPHQREGGQFMFWCVSGLHRTANIHGRILADDMGLGKTLQSITLLYTLLRQGLYGKSMVKKAIIVTPTSLVSNWEEEIKKWVGHRVQLIALCESSRGDVISRINNFTNPRSFIQVLIVSYETFRMHAPKFTQSGSCDLLICDEAHMLKNDQTMTNKALASLSCKRRILLSGTPMQNDLAEFYAMVNFTNPGIIDDAAHFRKYYQVYTDFNHPERSYHVHFKAPNLTRREPSASEKERVLGLERSEELSAKVNQFILRRTNALLSNHLPPKIIEVVCCKLTTLQSDLYNHFITSKNLIYDSINGGNSRISGFEDCLSFFPPEVLSGRSASMASASSNWVELSGKMNVLARLLAQIRQSTDDRIVLVSNYTQTLDLLAQLCQERTYPYLRLDGRTLISKRQELVNQFNDLSKDEFVFLLSSKAGGCGLNLIGVNRLILFDPDWNPANDKQAAARVWRDGQKKRVYIYRLLSTGTIVEKVYQRQMSKEGLQKVIQQDQGDSDRGNFFSTEKLRDLFTYNRKTRSESHEKMNCLRCRNNDRRESGACEKVEFCAVQSISGSINQNSDIGGFESISGLHSLRSSQRQVTFVFKNQIEGKLFPVESKAPKKRAVGASPFTKPYWSNAGGNPRQNPLMPSPQRTVMSDIKNLVRTSPAACVKPVQVAPLKSITPSLGDMADLSWKPELLLNQHSPLKRSYDTRDNDDIVCQH